MGIQAGRVITNSPIAVYKNPQLAEKCTTLNITIMTLLCPCVYRHS